jgi:hypothetical protein
MLLISEISYYLAKYGRNEIAKEGKTVEECLRQADERGYCKDDGCGPSLFECILVSLTSEVRDNCLLMHMLHS